MPEKDNIKLLPETAKQKRQAELEPMASAISDHTTGEPVADSAPSVDQEVDDEIPEGWCGHCACNSCYEIKRSLGQ